MERPPIEQEIPVIDQKGRPYRPDIKGKVNKNRGQCPKLNDRDRCSRLLGIAAVKIGPSAGKYKMCRRANGNELCQTLDYTEDERL